ncbi:MAG TPA: BNR repeat-containing protein [Mycobacteriales bacterium]|nr:BNR repeat-containing protein [Mycobacteriales bacterium]
MIVDMTHDVSRRRFLVRATLLSSTVAAGAGGLLQPATAGAAEPAARKLAYSDNFQRPDSTVVGDGWVKLRGSWSLVSQTLQPTGNTAQMQIAQTAFELGRDFTVEGTVSVNAPGGVHNGIAFNIHDLGNGNQSAYALTLSYGSPSIWALFNIVNSSQRFLPAFKVIDIEAGKPYTLRATVSRYGSFHVTILDGSTVLVSEPVDLDPFDTQLAGGFFGLYSQAGNADGTFQVHSINAQSSTLPSTPPPPRAAVPLVCTPVQGPPYQLPGTQWSVVNSSLVDQTQSQVAIGQALLTNGTTQYVAYYAADKEMTVAQRSTDSDTWVRQPLQNYVGTDGHNAVGCALDRDGQLHVAGNMHNVPLIYFRTSTAGDVTSLTRITSMVDPETEQSETYPVFLRNADGALIYNYRSGVSGSGATYYNIYDESTKTWSRLLDQPLFDGQGAGNSYPSSPTLGPDGYFHMVWVWRATGDAATNHDLCYARSKDMVHWETVDGDPLSLPIVQSTKGVVIDPIPMYNGLLNGVPAIGFDADKRVLISYYKLDKKLNTQVYIARPTHKNSWQVIQASSWTGRYFAEGIGTIPPQPSISAVSALPDGNLQMAYSYTPSADTSYSGTWIIDPKTLHPFTEAPTPSSAPAELTTVRSTFPNMVVELRGDIGSAGSPTQKYLLRYEGLQPPVSKPPYPDPSPLEVYLVESS